jgi:hypothetical protein
MQKQAGWSRFLLGGIEAYFCAVAKTFALWRAKSTSNRNPKLPSKEPNHCDTARYALAHI